jgi:hypothetical protein
MQSQISHLGSSLTQLNSSLKSTSGKGLKTKTVLVTRANGQAMPQRSGPKLFSGCTSSLHRQHTNIGHKRTLCNSTATEPLALAK